MLFCINLYTHFDNSRIFHKINITSKENFTKKEQDIITNTLERGN